MGSLMGGWDSPVLDPKVVKCQRNRSLTKGEIEAFWRSKKQSEEDHDVPQQQNFQEPEKKYQRSSSLRERGVEEEPEKKYQRSSSLLERSVKEEPKRKFHRSSSMPPPIRRNNPMDESKKPTNCWWTRSNWAFLNEPPVMETEQPQRHKYAPFHRGKNIIIT